MAYNELTVRSSGNNLWAGTLDGIAEATTPIVSLNGGSITATTYNPPSCFGANFNGTTQYLSMTNNSSVSCGDIDFWFSGWVKFTAVTGTQVIAGQWDDPQASWVIYSVGSASFNFSVSPSGATTGIGTATVTQTISTGVWYFILAWHDSVSNNINLKISNGTTATTAWTTGVFNGTSLFTLGTQYSSGAGSQYLNGQLDSICLGKNPVGGIASLISAMNTSLYNSANGKSYVDLTGSEKTDWGITAYWHLGEDNYTALSDRLSNLTLTNNAVVTFTSGKLGNAATFSSASSQYLSRADTQQLRGANCDFFISCWVNMSAKTVDKSIVGKYSTATAVREWELRYNQATDRFRFAVSADGTNEVFVDATTLGSPSTATWYYIMAYHDWASGVIKISVNGGAFDSQAHTLGVFGSTSAFTIGARATPANYFDGSIDSVVFGKPQVAISGVATTIRDLFYNAGTGISLMALNDSYRQTYDLVGGWEFDAVTTRRDSHSSNTLTNNNSVTRVVGKVVNNSENFVTLGVAANQFISLMQDGQSNQTPFISKIGSITANTITFSSTIKMGTVPTAANGEITAFVGGALYGPVGGNGFPWSSAGTWQALINNAGNPPRFNFKNDRTYLITSQINVGSANQTTSQGYTTTFADGGKATVSGLSTGNCYTVITGQSGGIFIDFIFTNNGNASGSLPFFSCSNTNGVLYRCIFKNCYGSGFSSGRAIACEAYNCNTGNTAAGGGFINGWLIGCVSHHNTSSTSGGNGFYCSSSTAAVYINCIAHSNTGAGFAVHPGNLMHGIIAVNNGTHGVGNTGNNLSAIMTNSYMGNNTGWGWNAGLPTMTLNCAFYNNSSGQVSTNQYTQAINVVVPSGDPLVAVSTGDFSLDSTANEGMLLRGSGNSLTPVAFDYTGYTTVPTGYPDIGAFQHKEPTDAELSAAIWGYVTRNTTA